MTLPSHAAEKGQPGRDEAPAVLLSTVCSGCQKKLKVRAELVGKKVKCPHCGAVMLVPKGEPIRPDPAPVRRFPIVSAIVLSVFVLGCAIYANLSFAVTDKANLAYFPPYKAHVDGNMNRHLGAEYLNIAQAIRAGKGFANPFKEPTGPTAWMPPVLPTLLAGLLWACDDEKDAVMTVVIFLQTCVLIGTGLLILALARHTTQRVSALLAVAVFCVLLGFDFHLCFQMTHDCWIVLLAVDLLIVGLCWWQPLRRWQTAATWGVFGGFCALVNPIVAGVWGLLSALVGYRERAWSRLAITVVVAGVTLIPWTVRNYQVFGRLIPVKSNLSYELYQSQCLQSDGLIQSTTFAGHPYSSAGRERQEYKALGEIEFIEQRKQKFWDAVRNDPADFLDRAAQRFLGATLWYTPFKRLETAKRPWLLWSNRVVHPLPFLAVVVLLFSSIFQRLHWSQWVVIGVYVLYLFPYIGASYYERYAIPLIGVKGILVIWGVDRVLTLCPTRERWRNLWDQEAVPQRLPEEHGRAVPLTH